MTTKTTRTTITLAMIHHADVVRPIKTTLRSFGVKAQDLEDGVAEVQTRTLEYLRGKPLPASTEEWVALGVTITRNWRLDEKKKAKTARKYCEGPCEDPDDRIGLEPAPGDRETLDARRLLRELEEQFDAGEMPERADEILDRVQAGMTYPKMAEELGMTPETVRMRLRRTRELFEARLAKLGISAMRRVPVALAAGPAIAANGMGPAAPPSSVPVPPPRVGCAR